MQAEKMMTVNVHSLPVTTWDMFYFSVVHKNFQIILRLCSTFAKVQKVELRYVGF